MFDRRQNRVKGLGLGFAEQGLGLRLQRSSWLRLCISFGLAFGLSA